MKNVLASVLTALLLVPAGCTVHSVSACATLNPCISENGIAVIGDDDSAQELLSVAGAGSEEFFRYFGHRAVPSAIVPGGVIATELGQQIEAAGFDVALPWLSAADRDMLRDAAIREQVLAQTQQLAPEQREAMIKLALAKARQAVGGASSKMPATQQGALTHELGHMWFKAAFQPGSQETQAKADHGYGGWAPDWLDETAAILLENSELRGARREAFRTAATEDLYPLGEFLTMTHPALASAQRLAAKFEDSEGTGSRAIVLSGDEADAFLAESKAGDPSVFYAQTQGFIDFVFALTDDERTFAHLARALSEGRGFEQWLADHPDLPDSIEALQEGWARWLEQR